MNDQEIFTTEEQNEDTKRREELINLVASGEAILIVGAGSSKRVGYPDWPELLEKLEDLASKYNGFKRDEVKRKDEPLEYAEDIKSHICNKRGNLGIYHDLLYELFQSKSPAFDDLHKILVSLPFRGILTTNYDTVLKEALSQKKRDAEGKEEKIPLIDENPLVIGQDPPRLIHEFLLARNNDPQIPQRIAHLHGVYRNPDRIILSSNDYIKAYGLRVSQGDHHQGNEDRWTLHRKLLWAVLATRRVVFVGFSMEDPYFNEMLETVSTDLWGWDKSIHFAVMSIAPESAEGSKDKAAILKSEYGVDTVFYKDLDNLHQGLEDIVTEIAKSCNVEIQPTTDDDENWLERVNQRMERRMGDEN